MAVTSSRSTLARPSKLTLCGVILVLALIAAACGGGDAGSDEVSVADETTDEVTQETAAATTDTATDAEDNEAIAGEPTPAPTKAPRPTPTPAPTNEIVLPDIDRHDFEWGEGDTDWDVSIFGYVETDRDDGDDPGSCAVIVGVLVPTLIDEGIAANSGDTPQFGVEVDDEYIEEDFYECAVDGLENQGYAPLYATDVLAGAPFTFYVEVPLESGNAAATTAIVVGDPVEQANKALTLDPIRVTNLPAPVTAPADLEPLDGVSVVDARVTTINDGVEWELVLDGLTSVDTSDGDDSADCAVITGTATPLATDEGTTASYAPPLYVVAGGVLLEANGASSCATSSLTDLGYRPLSQANVTVGTSYAFVQSVRIPPALADGVRNVLVGDPHRVNDYSWSLAPLTAKYVGTVEPAEGPVSGANHPETQGTVVGATFAWTSPWSEVEWLITTQGVVETETSFSDDGSCFVIVGTMVPTASADEDPIDGYNDGPDWGMFANGNHFEDFASLCETDAIEASGFGDSGDAELAVGDAYPFYAEVQVSTHRGFTPSVVVIGDPTTDNTLYFDVGVLPEVPAPGSTPDPGTAVAVVPATTASDTDSHTAEAADSTDAPLEGFEPTPPINSTTDSYIDADGFNSLETSGVLATGDAVRRIPLTMKAGEAFRFRVDAPDGADLIAMLTADPVTTQALIDFIGEPEEFDDLYSDLAERHPDQDVNGQVMFISEGDLQIWLTSDFTFEGQAEAGNWVSPIDADYTMILTYFSDYAGSYELNIQDFAGTFDFGDFESWLEIINGEVYEEPFFTDEGYFGSPQG